MGKVCIGPVVPLGRMYPLVVDLEPETPREPSLASLSCYNSSYIYMYQAVLGLHAIFNFMGSKSKLSSFEITPYENALPFKLVLLLFRH